jgi:hypothetical protein
MTLLEFIDKHPVFTFLIVAIVLITLHDIVVAWRAGGKNNS